MNILLKKAVRYILSFGALYFIGLYLHENIFFDAKTLVDFPLKKVYQFHLIASLAICLAFLFLKLNKKIAPQLGFLYLAGVLLKFFFFALTFKDLLVESPKLQTFQALSFLIPTVIFLFFEVFFIVRILRDNEH